MKTRYYTMFVMLYITIMCITILMAYKPLQFDSLIFPGGIFVFPIVYFINDAMSEIYGYREAKKVILIGFFCQLFFVTIVSLINSMPSPSFWHHQQEYNTTLHPIIRCFISVSAGVTIGGIINTYFISKWKVLTRGRLFWIRSIGASAIGEVFQSLITFTIAFLYTMPMKSFLSLVVAAGLFKLSYSVIMALFGSHLVMLLKRTETVKDPDMDQACDNPFKTIGANYATR